MSLSNPLFWAPIISFDDNGIHRNAMFILYLIVSIGTDTTRISGKTVWRGRLTQTAPTGWATGGDSHLSRVPYFFVSSWAWLRVSRFLSYGAHAVLTERAAERICCHIERLLACRRDVIYYYFFVLYGRVRPADDKWRKLLFWLLLPGMQSAASGIRIELVGRCKNKK